MENEFSKKLFAQRLKEIRKSKGLTQEEVCEMTGIEVSNYSKMETAKVAPSLASLHKLITLAGFAPNEIFNFDHLETEENLNKMIQDMYNNFSISQKRTLYKLMRTIEEYK